AFGALVGSDALARRRRSPTSRVRAGNTGMASLATTGGIGTSSDTVTFGMPVVCPVRTRSAVGNGMKVRWPAGVRSRRAPAPWRGRRRPAPGGAATPATTAPAPPPPRERLRPAGARAGAGPLGAEEDGQV